MRGDDRTGAPLHLRAGARGLLPRGTRRRAQAAGLSGWVRNRTDGRVEAIFQGDETAVRQLVDWCHTGPARARVRDVTVEWEDPVAEPGGFTVLPTSGDG